MQNSKRKLENRLTRLNTNHLLHLLLALISVGFWTPIWILVTINNAIERARVLRKLEAMEEDEHANV